jgi:hypothetical protein
MKKRILAMVMALTMVVGTGMTAMANGETMTSQSESKTHDTAGTDHGDETDALLGPSGEFENQSGSTQFYINIDKDKTSGEVTITEPSIVDGDGEEICHYYKETKVIKKSTIKATVPLYVCMYGYGGDGRVVTPGEDSYQIKNESTYSISKEISKAYACYKVYPIPTEGEYKEEITKENEETTLTDKKIEEEYKKFLKDNLKIDEDDAANASQQYGYYKKDNNYTVIELANCIKHSAANRSGDNCDSEYFYQDTSTDVKDKLKKEGNETTVVEDTPLPLNIASIETEIKTWALKPVTDANELKAGELAMTINGLDLSEVSNATGSKLDITGRKWTVPAGKDNNYLSLPIQAQIAGGNVNEDGCVPVVKVTYTITPDETVNEVPTVETETNEK